MILSCTQCHARYLAPAVHFAAGPRMVRCARCQHSWLAALPAEPAETLALQLSALTAHDQIAPPPLPPSPVPVVQPETGNIMTRHFPIAALATTAFVSLILLGLFRTPITDSYPAMDRVYDRVGLHVFKPGEGLTIGSVRSEMRFDDGIMDLVVEGQIHNDTKKDQLIPDILAEAVGPDGTTMQSWQIDTSKAKVAPGDAVPFTSAIHAPKGTVVEINLHFVEPGHGN
jgi:predicted Zn finger-like uncharacterized protein